MDPPLPLVHPHSAAGQPDVRSTMTDWDADDIPISFGSFSVEDTVKSKDDSHVRTRGAALLYSGNHT